MSDESGTPGDGRAEARPEQADDRVDAAGTEAAETETVSADEADAAVAEPTAPSSEPMTGEVDVPAAPRSAQQHVNAEPAATPAEAAAPAEPAAAPAEPARSAETGFDESQPGFDEPRAQEPDAQEPAPEDVRPEQPASEQPAPEQPTPEEPQPVTAVYDEDAAQTEVGWAPTPAAAPPAPATEEVPPPAPEHPAAQPQGTVYITAPTPPKPRGNRAAGILISIVAAIAFAVLSAAVVLAIFAITKASDPVAELGRYVATPAYWATAIIFALALFLLCAIANRGGWWWYVIGGFFVGVIVYFAYIGATLLTNAGQLSPDQVPGFVAQLWAHPLTFATAVVAREVTVWFGAWIAARGRAVQRRNLETQREYDRTMAENPPLYPAG